MSVRVVLTREAPRNDALAAALRRHCHIDEVPLTSTQWRIPTLVAAQLSKSVHRGAFASVVLTSERAVRYLAQALSFARPDADVGAVGHATAEAVRASGALGTEHQLLVAEIENARDLARVVHRGPVLALSSAQARDDLRDALEAKGLQLESVEVYATVPQPPSGRAKKQVENADVIVVAAPSAWRVARYLVAASTDVVAIGPTTAAEVREHHELVHEASVSDLAVVVLSVIEARAASR